MQIVTELEGRAKSLEANMVHLLTTDAADFFGTFDYVRADRGAAPLSITATAQFVELCAVMVAYLVESLR